MSIFHPRENRAAPDGCTLAGPREIRGVLYGVNRRVADFPQGMDGVIAECMEKGPEASPAPLRREPAEGLEGVRFERPPAHRKRLKRVGLPVGSSDFGPEEPDPSSTEGMEMPKGIMVDETPGFAGRLAEKQARERDEPPEMAKAPRNLAEPALMAESGRLRNERSPAAARGRIVNGPDADEPLGAEGEFGRDPDNPVPANGIFGERLRLSTPATDEAGREPLRHRPGLGAGRPGPAAARGTVSADGEKRDILYFSTRHPRKSRKTPAGYAFAEKDAASMTLMRGSARRVKRFPHGVKAQAPGTVKEISGPDFPSLSGSLADPDVRFRRPPLRPARLKTATDGLADPRGGAGEAPR